MDKIKFTHKNRLLTVPKHLYSGVDEVGSSNFLKKALDKAGGTMGVASAAAGAVGGLVGNAISGGLSSGAGNAISGVGNTLGAIPVLGGFAKGALNIVGGGVNALFGMKTNQAELNRVNKGISALNDSATAAAGATSFDDESLMGPDAINFNVNAYKGGLFSKGKARRKNAALQAELKDAYNYANRTSDNTIGNIADTQLDNVLATSAAFGGELNTNGADFPTGLMFIDEGGTHESNPYEGVPMGIAPDGKPNLVEEGETIFNDYVFSRRLLVPKTIRNKYKLGDKLTFAEASKKLAKVSEERPNDPISQETLHEIMSDLATVQEEVRQKKQARQEGVQYAHGGKMGMLFDGDGTYNQFLDNYGRNPYEINGGQTPNWTIAPNDSELLDIAKEGIGGFSYTPYNYVPGYNGGWFDNNGNYTKAYLDKVNSMSIADINNAFNEQYKYYINKANKNTDRWKAIDAFYAANPQYKVASTNLTDAALPEIRKLATDGNPGFMHQFFNDAATPLKRANRYFLRGTDAQGNPTVTPMEITPWEGLNEKGQSFSEAFPTYNFKGKQERPKEGDTIYTDYYYDKSKPKDESEDEQEIKKDYEGFRYAPAIGLGMAALSDALGITNKPDYTEAAQIEAATKGSSYMPISWNPIGNKLTYKPLDRDYATNKLRAEAGATRRTLTNLSGGNRGSAMAGILAADYNAQDRLGNLFRQAEEYNLAQRQQVEDFNRATNQTNSQGKLQADMANQQAYANARDYALRGTMAAAEMRQKARMAAEAAKSANLSGFLSALGDIGYENKGMNMIRALYASDAIGHMHRKIAEGFNLIKPQSKNKNSKKEKSKSLTGR
ncbi:hypothetical protein [uncultured phage cr116_1]|uniref:Cargo protein 1 compact domain-containing protein n=1 Tax=uncultured phage cr116_1 TaxID=2772073 RepID=A0A7M1RYG1_9CAUD|nr:hypothetical protein KNV40_gp045 [uncultured phage cr116_1]QOR59398.1 hypothetical protein [uncultured phage cr116_1]DAK53109.1 MAG TPA: hypothetical protein [Crassvirales sp.]